ncbi:MAG: recombinase family protein [Phyllobacterium sp.]|uniref:recombinase family protein n=1 Tax=Phyllobacterium sp. TaxID=1871046 RepID=UPI0030EFE7A7
MLIRAYLRASTDEQDANRARAALKAFADTRDLRIGGYYVENESGASLARPQLFRLLADSEPGDVLLTEQVDRLSRLTADDWERLKAEIAARKLRIVALDLPTSWTLAAATADDFQGRVFEAINAMMLDVLAAVARKDYEDRRRRQNEGIAKAKASGLYRGRREDVKRNAAIMDALRKGQSWQAIIDATGVGRATVARLARRVKDEVRVATFNGQRSRRSE